MEAKKEMHRAAEDMWAALGVFLTCPETAAMLQKRDPKAFEQAIAAVRKYEDAKGRLLVNQYCRQRVCCQGCKMESGGVNWDCKAKEVFGKQVDRIVVYENPGVQKLHAETPSERAMRLSQKNRRGPNHRTK